MIVFEITIQVRNLCVRILFNDKPTLKRICECVSMIFANNTEVEIGLINLILSVGDGDQSDLKLNVGDQIQFKEDDQQIGYMDLQTRTLFDA